MDSTGRVVDSLAMDVVLVHQGADVAAAIVDDLNVCTAFEQPPEGGPLNEECRAHSNIKEEDILLLIRQLQEAQLSRVPEADSCVGCVVS